MQCEQINSRLNLQDLLKQNEVLFQCEKNSGVFLAACTQGENKTNCTGCFLAGGEDCGSVGITSIYSVYILSFDSNH